MQIQNARNIDDAIKGSHDFMAKRCSQLLRKRVLHLSLLVLEKLRNVIDDKSLHKLISIFDSFDFDLKHFG